MASVETSKYQGRYLKLTVVEESISIPNNTSTVKWILESIGGSSTWYTIYNCRVVVNGEEVYNPGTVSWDEKEFPAAVGSESGTITVEHKSDGTADPISFELHGKVYTSGDEDKHGTLDLSTIPRETSITSFSVDKRNETSFTFNWQTADIVDKMWYSTNNGANWTETSIAEGTSGSFIVSGLSANTSYNCKISVRRKDSGLITNSNTVSQTTYKIPTHSLSSKTLNTITVNWSCDSEVNRVWYSLNGGTSWVDLGNPQATTGTYTITELSPNTTYNIITSIQRKLSNTYYNVGDLSVTTYDIGKITSVANFNHGDNAMVVITNPSGSMLNLSIIIGNTQILSKIVQGGSNIINFTDAQLDSIYRLYGNGNTLTANFALITAGTYTYTKTATIRLTGNQKTGHINVDSWKRSNKWLNINGDWKRCVRWININGSWKRCI